MIHYSAEAEKLTKPFTVHVAFNFLRSHYCRLIPKESPFQLQALKIEINCLLRNVRI